MGSNVLSGNRIFCNAFLVTSHLKSTVMISWYQEKKKTYKTENLECPVVDLVATIRYNAHYNLLPSIRTPRV